MLHEFIDTHRDEIITKSRAKLTDRPWPAVSTEELQYGVPLFLTQLAESLRLETSSAPAAHLAMRDGATRHGRELLALGFTVSQVVHDYGDICQAITEVAVEQEAAITTEEFHNLNRCLDLSIAEAVTEHARITAELRSTDETERAGQLGHEMRNLLNTALLAFHTLKRGLVAINGNTGSVLGRSLMSLRDAVDTTLSDIRMDAKIQRRDTILVKSLLDESAVAAVLHAEYSGRLFTMDPVDPELTVSGDPQLLASAVMNLLNNAFKYTPKGGRVHLRAVRNHVSVHIEVADECGGIPPSAGDPFHAFGERRGSDRTGLGLGLSISRRAVQTAAGEISFRNSPGKGCVFVIDLPLSSAPRPPTVITRAADSVPG